MDSPVKFLKAYFKRKSFPVPESPTESLPGTLEKIEVLRDRVERGERLWHPNDKHRTDPETD